MADHFHDVGDLVSSNDASALALSTDLRWHTILVGFENSGLVKANCRGVYVHVAEHNIRIADPSR